MATLDPQPISSSITSIPCTDEAKGRHLRQWSDLLPRFYLPLILLLCAVLAWRLLGAGDDFWAHAAIGRWMWQHGQVPHQTLFIWSTPPIPWVAHSWLTQLTFYVLMAIGGEYYGPHLALALTVLLAALPFYLIWRLWIQHNTLTSLMPVVFTIAIWCASPRFRPRPEMFTAAFLACLLVFLIKWRNSNDTPVTGENKTQDGRQERQPWRPSLMALAIPLMFVVWANYHGAVAIGLVVLMLSAGCDLLQDRFDVRSRWLLLITLLSVAAVFVNPFGMDYWAALKPVRSPMFSRIDEWKPFWLHPKLGVEYAVGEAVLVLIAAAAWFANPQRRWAHLAWLIFMSVSFISARRHLWLLALASLAVMAANARVLDTDRLWALWRRYTQPRSYVEGITTLLEKPPILRLLTQVGIIICMITWIVTITPRDFLPLKAVSRFIPKKAIAFIKQQRLPGNIFNDYESSSYLQWRFAGRPPLYIDLLNAYPGHLLEPDYFQMLDAKTNKRGRRLLQKVGYVFLRRHNAREGLATLASFLDGEPKRKNPQWVRVYKEPDGTIWVRRTKVYERLWRKAERQAKRKARSK